MGFELDLFLKDQEVLSLKPIFSLFPSYCVFLRKSVVNKKRINRGFSHKNAREGEENERNQFKRFKLH
jgi:hypothetical protein